MASFRSKRRLYNVRVMVERAAGMTETDEPNFETALPCYCRVTGAQSINVSGRTGTERQDSFTLTFQPGHSIRSVRTAQGGTLVLTPGSRITYAGRYYAVVRVEDQIDEVNGRTVEAVAYLSDAGRAA